jgi:iron complex transport system ATP-binding protein
MSLLSLKSACAAPWGDELLRDIEFELDRGQVMSILGPNGAGKTTLLNMLCGSVPLTRGELQLADQVLSRWPIMQLARSQAVLPQQSSLNFPFTVEEVVLLGRTPHATGVAIDGNILDAVLEATDTSALRQRIYTRLSGGEKQRVQLARVFAQVWRAEDSETRLLLLDEPTSSLDLSHQQLIMESVARLARQGCAVAMVLHDFNLASRYTDCCLVLDSGRQWAWGTPREVLTQSMFRAVFEVDVHITDHPDSACPLVIQS